MYEIKREVRDFVVEEITPGGEVLEIDKEYDFGEDEGDQLICVMQKYSWDTHLAIRRISDALGVSRKRVGFAGMKDKFALTTQRISLWGITPDDVGKLQLKDIEVNPLEYSQERIELGDLWGNRFTVKVYSDKPPKKETKMPNYFGVQRFGEVRPITHVVGKEIVLGDVEEAVKIYAGKVFPDEGDEAREARTRLSESWDYKEAIKYFPKNLKFERTLIAHLAQYPNDYVNALRKLPKFLRLMFVHAYQSHLFNRFLDAVVEQGLDYDTGPLYGYESVLENDLEKSILEKEMITLQQFRIGSMPEMSSRGMRRQLFVELKDFEILEQGEGFYVVRFSLPRGCYATVAIDFLFG
jgi:tRNA pseudouridine13 synthase